MLEHFGSRQLHEGVADALARLKKAAERSQQAAGKWVLPHHRVRTTRCDRDAGDSWFPTIRVLPTMPTKTLDEKKMN